MQIFQSTHPARGATCAVIVLLSVVAISIHAPREGCDKVVHNKYHNKLRFQSTHPARGATGLYIPIEGTYDISIHAPREGCDSVYPDNLNKLIIISIHAPREGCDQGQPVRSLDKADFNPRTPRGVRQRHPLHSGYNCKFQSTHPARGATFNRTSAPTVFQFQSTHPARGATYQA